MLVVCKNHITIARLKHGVKFNNTFNFHFEQKNGVKSDNRHRRFAYFGESYSRFDEKANKIKNN